MKAVYTGHEPRMFLDYLDLETGRTLYAEPGGVYDVWPAGGRNVPDVPPGFGVYAAAEKKQPARAAKAAPGPDGESGE